MTHTLCNEEATYFWEISCDNSSVRKLSASKRRQCLVARLWRIKLDEYLANSSRLSAATHWTGNLQIKDISKFGAFLANIVADFWSIC